jgi:hypothetical protein
MQTGVAEMIQERGINNLPISALEGTYLPAESLLE